MQRSQDRYFGAPVSLSDPANEAIDIVPGEELDDVARGIFIGGGGDVVMKGGDDDDWHTWKNVPPGSWLPFRVREVRMAGTTATAMLALY